MRKFRVWPEDEIKFLINNRKKLTASQIGRKINRTEQAVYWKARDLGIPGKGRIKSIKECKALKLDKLDLGYIAGIVDGEGSIGLYHQNRRGYDEFHPFISITNVDKKMLEHIKKVTGIGHIRLHAKPKNKNHSTTYRYCIEDICNAYIFCCTLEPYLIIKKKQAQAIIRYSKIKEKIIDKKINRKRGTYLLRNISKKFKKINFQCNALRIEG